jgi:hypothetical protein
MLNIRLTGTARIFLAVAMWIAAGCMGGCGGYDVGPDPMPWSPPEEPAARSSGN